MKTIKIILTIGILAVGFLFIHSCKKEKEYSVSSVSLDREELKIGEGDTAHLTCTVKPKQAKNQEVKWKSSDITVAHVDKNGIVTGLSMGEAVITVTSVDGGKKATCQVTVIRPVPVTDISLTPEDIMMETGDTSSVMAALLPDDATNTTITWTINNSAIAEITPGGSLCKIKVKANGTAVITATSHNGKTATCNLTVADGVIGQNVYISGRSSSGSSIWKQQNVVYTFKEKESISGIFVSGNNVYAIGAQSASDKTTIQLWKNGVATGLQNSVKHTGSSGYGPAALSVYVDKDENVYVGGSNCIEREISGGVSASNHPTVWKNRVELYRLHQDWDGWVYSIFISGNDIYSVGEMYSSGWGGGGRVWKNETLLYDFNSTIDRATGIYVWEGDIYIAAKTGSTGRIYKNGTLLYSLSAAPNSIFVSNGDIYTSGEGAIWKNDKVLYDLGAETGRSVVVKDNKVYYTAGNKVYKNGVATTLPGCTEAISVFVK